MPVTQNDLYRSVHLDDFAEGTVIAGQPAPEVLYPDFVPRLLKNGRVRLPDVRLSKNQEWIHTGGGTSLFDQANVFKNRKFWLNFPIPKGTNVPASLKIRFTHYHEEFKANHFQIESSALTMRVDAYKGALDNLARNALVRSIELASMAK